MILSEEHHYPDWIMTDISNLHLFLAILTAVNVAVFVIFASDKRAAQKNARRTPERTLIVSAIFGPFGAYLAMKVFRHKTRKMLFYLVPLFAFFQLFLMVGACIRILNTR